jgi:hypothetical protein
MAHLLDFYRRIRRWSGKDKSYSRRRWPPAVDTVKLERTAHRQIESSFFGRLPLEVRQMIYLEVWRNAGLRQHIFLKDNELLRRTPCLAPSLAEIGEGGVRGKTLQQSPENRWGVLHRNCLKVAYCTCPLAEPCDRCQELIGGGRSAIHPMLLSCKRM